MDSHISSVRPNPFHSSESLTSRIDPAKPVEAMLFMLPGIGKHEEQKFRNWATAAGLVHYIRGDGERALQRDEFSKPVPGDLKRNAHIFINGHGNDSAQGHTMCIDEENEISETTSSLMIAARTIPREEFATDSAQEENITLHMFGCRIGALKKQTTPHQPLWKSGTFLMYGSRKTASNMDQLPCMKAALDYLGLIKNRSEIVNPLGLFEAIASQRSDCVSIAGGKLSAAVVAHAPHVLRDIMRPIFQPPETTDPLAKQDKRISAPVEALQSLVQFESQRIASMQKSDSSYPADEHITRLLMNCIERDDIITLSDILAERQDLMQTTDADGNTMLIWAVLTDAIPEITQFLINHTNTINAHGKYGMTALHCAAEENDVFVIKQLLAGSRLGDCAELNRRDHAGNTPLTLALNRNSLKAAFKLVDAGANVHLANHAGETPLMLAAELGDLELVRLLLRFNPDLNATDRHGETAALKAKRNGHDLLAQALEKIAGKWAATANQPAPYSNQTQPAASGH